MDNSLAFITKAEKQCYGKQNHSTWKTREQFHLLRFDLTKARGAKFLTAVIALNHPSSSWLSLQPRRILAIASPIPLAPCIHITTHDPGYIINVFLGGKQYTHVSMFLVTCVFVLAMVLYYRLDPSKVFKS